VDIKRRLGNHASYHKTIPDGYLLDFTSRKQPQLYFVENELAWHDPYSHIFEQIGRFVVTSKNAKSQIRSILLDEIKKDAHLAQRVREYLKDSPFSNIEETMIFVTEKNEIRIVVVINEETPDLILALDAYRERPDVAVLQRYARADEIVYSYEPMREELEEEQGRSTTRDFDTVVCPAFEDGFKQAYVENNAWWAIRLSHNAREKIHHLAIYEKAPAAVVRHVAEIDRIEPYKNSGKYKVFLKNKQEVRPIPLDKDKKGVAPQAPRFTTYDKLRKAKKISELWQ
jgi:hypothetical protein